MIRLLISCDPFITRAAKIDDGKLCVFTMRRKSDAILVGNIYKGIVANVSRSLNAAFIDIGIGKNAFLPLEKREPSNLAPGDEVIVQVFKPLISTKGPKVTTNITLPGNYIVLLRNNNFIGISRQIKDQQKAEWLRDLLKSRSNATTGFIARTASQLASYDELVNEINYLISINRTIDEKIRTTRAPGLVYEEQPLPTWVIREYCDKMTDEVYIDNPVAYKHTKTYLERTNSPYLEKLKLYEGKEPILRHFGIEEQIKTLESGRVTLKNGAYITIEKTEALFAIDVNSGKCQYRCDVEDAIFEINKEAAYEIFNQITLRDMGGIIVVDFIDMENEEHKRQLEAILEELAAKNRRETHVSKISPFGLVEISRRKNDNDIFDKMFEKCEWCSNSGLVKGAPLICSEIYEQIRYSNHKRFKLTATAHVIEHFKQRIGDMDGRIIYKIKDGCNAEDYTLEVIE